MFNPFRNLFRKDAPQAIPSLPEEWGYIVHDTPITSAEECAEVIRRGEIVNMFCSLWANYRDEQGNTLLHLAAGQETERTVKLLLPYFDATAQNIYGATPLHAAAAEGSAETVKALLDAGADVNARDRQRRTPIFYAIAGNNAPTLQAMLCAGADPDARDAYGFTARDYKK